MQNNRFMLCFWMLLFLITGCGHQTKDVEKPTVDTIPMMVMQIQKCSRLYTTEYQLRKIVTYGDSVSINGSFLHQDFKIDLPMGRRKVAIPMTANVKAYIDFSNFSEKNIKKHDGKIEIILPDPEFIMTSTQVNHAGIKKKVSVLRKNFSDEEITRLQQQGRNDMIKSLPKLGIMENARQNAARQIFPIIEQMGYSSDDVTITFRKKFTWNDFPSLIKKTE